MAALRCNGITAPCVFDQPIDAISVLAWVTQVPVPTLRRGDVVVMDNLSSHKTPAIPHAIPAAGALQFLPPNSSDLNPIEQASSKLKTPLHKENARTREQAEDGIGTLLKLAPRRVRQLRPRRRIRDLKQSRSSRATKHPTHGHADG